jgi:mercuric reductase
MEVEVTFEYDLAIVGSGGGAFAAAIAARDRGLRVAMMERETVGGTCVNVGCIPSKALLAAAESRDRALHQRFPGITTTAQPADFAALIAGKREIVAGVRQSKYVDLAGEYGFDTIAGDARFLGGPALDVDGRRLEAVYYLVATGADPHVPEIPGLAGSGYLTSTTAMELEQLPARLDAAIDVARDEGAADLSLGTGEDDVAARALYESLGFSNRESNGALNLFYERQL